MFFCFAVSEERHFDADLIIHRKGAIHLLPEQLGIIPGSMGTPSYIVKGRGIPYSFNSCSHGAGRVMSRGEARRSVSEKEVRQSMAGVVYDETIDLKDEAPQAYKDIRRVLRGQKDLVKVVCELKPFVSLKG